MAKKEKAEGETVEKKSKVGRGVKAEPGERAERARKYPATMKIKVLNKERVVQTLSTLYSQAKQLATTTKPVIRLST